MIYVLENQYLKIQVNSLGAELWSIFDKRDGTEHIWQGDPAYWPRRAPTLFPVCGRLTHNGCRIDGKAYNMPMHGFARDYEHEMAEQTDTSLRFRFTQNDKTLALYPFAFQLDTIFELNGTVLTHTFEVSANGERRLPFCIGYHTGYTCPFDDQHPISDYSLVFEQKETAKQLLGNGLMTGGERLYLDNEDTIPLRDDLFADDSFILTGLKSDYVSIVENSTGRAVKVRIKGFPYVVFWSSAKRIPYVCVEPWYGLPDAENADGDYLKKTGLQTVAPGDCFRCFQTIEIQSAKE